MRNPASIASMNGWAAQKIAANREIRTRKKTGNPRYRCRTMPSIFDVTESASLECDHRAALPQQIPNLHERRDGLVGQIGQSIRGVRQPGATGRQVQRSNQVVHALSRSRIDRNHRNSQRVGQALRDRQPDACAAADPSSSEPRPSAFSAVQQVLQTSSDARAVWHQLQEQTHPALPLRACLRSPGRPVPLPAKVRRRCALPAGR